jgi:hypothetical protein
MVLERPDGGRDDPRQMLHRTSPRPVGFGQFGEEALRAAFHDREQDPVLGPVVVVDGAHRDAGLLDHAGEGRSFEPLLGQTRPFSSPTDGYGVA